MLWLVQKMKVAMIGILIILFVGVVFGTIEFPSLDDLMLLLSSSMFVLLMWMYKKEKETREVEE